MSIAILDTMVRANENPISFGGKWTTGITTGTALKIVSNAAVRQGASGSFGRDGSYWNALTFAAGLPCQVGATITNVGSDGTGDMLLWNPGAAHGYALQCLVGTFGTEFDLIRYDSTSVSVVIDRTTNFGTPATNDQVVLQIDGDDIVGWLFRSSVWNEILRAVDTTYRPAFNPGAEIAGLNDVSSLSITNFGANLLPAVNTVRLPSDTPFVYMRSNV